MMSTIQSPSTNLNLKGEELNRTDSEGGASTLQLRTKHEEPMKIYCFTCCCFIYQDCTIDKDHSGHNHVFIKSAAPETKKKLVQHLDTLKKVEMSLSHAVKEVQSTKINVR